MKNIKNLVVAVACCVGMTLNACQLLMTNDGATGLRVRDKNAPDVSMYIAPGATKLTMDLTGDDSTLEFFVESKRKGVYNKKYTLSILVCAINPADNIMNFSTVQGFVQNPIARFVVTLRNLNNFTFPSPSRIVMECMQKECMGMKCSPTKQAQCPYSKA